MSRIRKALRTAKSTAYGVGLGGMFGFLIHRSEEEKGSDRERLVFLSKAHSTCLIFAGIAAKSYNKLKLTGKRSNPEDVRELIHDLREIWMADELWTIEDELDDSPPNKCDLVN